jgi:hypothetical protein
MRNGGNQRARAFFRKHGFDSNGTVDKAMLSVKYESRPAALYRKELADLVDSPEGKQTDSFLGSYKQKTERASLVSFFLFCFFFSFFFIIFFYLTFHLL